MEIKLIIKFLQERNQLFSVPVNFKNKQLTKREVQLYCNAVRKTREDIIEMLRITL